MQKKMFMYFLFIIGNIIEETANQHGYSIVPAFAGHGIGTYFHGPPDILHFGMLMY